MQIPIRKSFRNSALLFVSMLCMASASLGQDLATAEVQARTALAEFLTAWNSGDIANVREALNYPHVTHAAGMLVIAHQPREFRQDFDSLRRQGWASSTFDRVTTYQVSPNKVNFGVDFSRKNASGETYQTGHVFYVFSEQDGKWGMQYRSGVPNPAQFDASEIALAVQEATGAVYSFFAAFNAADPVALRRVVHMPQAMMNNASFIEATTEASPLMSPNFTAMRETEGWDHSIIQDLNPVSVSPAKVIFELAFERVNREGDVYRRVPAMWTLSKVDGRWGVEFRSLMVPTRDVSN
ncbi:MAG: hypothetical protein QGG02_14625 [Gammaproteobacteria bacterium]|nr:hypothetical protein [Gammaproteobacteria bacterium]MDP6733293.1 hypothetical protein [Gammaproteobacteria bacterium]